MDRVACLVYFLDPNAPVEQIGVNCRKSNFDRIMVVVRKPELSMAYPISVINYSMAGILKDKLMHLLVVEFSCFWSNLSEFLLSPSPVTQLEIYLPAKTEKWFLSFEDLSEGIFSELQGRCMASPIKHPIDESTGAFLNSPNQILKSYKRLYSTLMGHPREGKNSYGVNEPEN